jgi:hypothetical protein
MSIQWGRGHHGGMEIFGIEKRKIGDYELLVWITTV